MLIQQKLNKEIVPGEKSATSKGEGDKPKGFVPGKRSATPEGGTGQKAYGLGFTFL